MLYTAQTRRAMAFAYAAHSGQNDKSGVPYIFHPYHLAEQMETEDEIVTALLHDVVEDTSVSIEDLRREGFGEKVLEAVKLLTHKEDEDYLDYIRRLKVNSIAQKVKLADLLHNSDFSRMKDYSEKTKERLEKYKKAIQILTEK